MFERMSEINKLVSKKILDIESEVNKSEAIFVEEINKLMKAKTQINSFKKRLA